MVAPSLSGGGHHAFGSRSELLLVRNENCAPERTRTPNQPGRNRLLYPLSYGRL